MGRLTISWAQTHKHVTSTAVVTTWNPSSLPIRTLVSTATWIWGESVLCLWSSVWHLHLALVPVGKQRKAEPSTLQQEKTGWPFVSWAIICEATWKFDYSCFSSGERLKAILSPSLMFLCVFSCTFTHKCKSKWQESNAAAQFLFNAKIKTKPWGKKHMNVSVSALMKAIQI